MNGIPAGLRNQGAPTAALLVTLILSIGCAPKAGGPGGAGGFKPPPMPAEMAVAEVGRVTDRFDAVGTLEGDRAVTVVSEIDGRLLSLPFQEGGRIEKGAVIAVLDDGQLKAEYDRTQALRDQARTTFGRVKSIVDQNAGSAEDMDNASSQLKVAEANFEVAKSRLSKAHISAPFTGQVGAKKVSVGTFLRAGSAITDLADVYNLKVTFSAPERYLATLRAGAEVDISTPAVPGESRRGVIAVIEPMVDADTRSAKMVARLANPGGRFRPGMSATVSAVLGTRAKAIQVPSEAIFSEGDQTFLYVMKPDTTVARTAVKLGARTETSVEVLDGLAAGAMVVKTGQQKLFDGAKIIPIPPGAGGPGSPGGAAPAGAAPAGAGGGKPGGASKAGAGAAKAGK